jgi:hypothetical protein
VTALIVPTMPGRDYVHCGLLWRDSSSEKCTSFGPQHNGAYRIMAATWNSATSFGAEQQGVAWQSGGPLWLRLEDDNTNRNAYVSSDGYRWVKVYSVSRATWQTPNQVGFFSSAGNYASPILDLPIVLKSWTAA